MIGGAPVCSSYLRGGARVEEDLYSFESRPDVVSNDDSLQFDRREVVAGLVTSAVLASTAANAEGTQKNKPDIRIVRNPKRHNELGVAIDFAPPQGDPIALVLYAHIFDGVNRPQGRTKGNPSFRDLDRFSFDDITFSNRGKYKLEFVIQEASGVFRISANFGRNAAGGRAATAEPVELATFARGEEGLKFPLSWSEAEMFRWTLFGERLEVKGGDGATLILKLILPQQRDPRSPWSEPRFSLTFAANPKSKFWAFEGAVKFTRLIIQKSDSDRGDGANIQEQQELANFDRKTGIGTYRSQAWVGYSNAELGLEWDVGTSRNAPSSDKKNGPKRYEIGNTRPGRKKPSVEIVQESNPTRLTFRQWGRARSTLAVLRSPVVVTLLSAHEGLPGKRPGQTLPYPSAVFHLSDAMLTKQDVARVAGEQLFREVKGERISEELEEILVGRLDDKPFSVETPYGAFIVEGDPPPKKNPSKGGSADIPEQRSTKGAEKPEDRADPLGRPIGRYVDFALQPAKGLTQLHVAAKNNEVRSFDARGLLRHVSVVLPNARARLAEEKIVEEAAEVWSRLDFNGTEVAFFLPLTGTGEQQPWPSARGVVTLCDLPRKLSPLSTVPKLPAEQSATSPAQKIEPPVPPPVAIALDGAHLQARRDCDNLSLSFEFSRMVLELGQNRARIVPNLRKSGGGAGQAAWVEHVRNFDDRPLLITHFPPQHVAERAYYRQINDGISLPDVPSSILSIANFAKQLTDWRKLPEGQLPNGTNPKFEARKQIYVQEEAARKNIQDDSSHPQFENLERNRLKDLWDLTDATGKPDKWQDKVGGAKAKLVARWNALPLDQRAFYLGTSSQAMDPDVRTVWLDIWRAYRENEGKLPPGDARVVFEEQLQRLPDPGIDDSILKDIKRRLPDYSGAGAVENDVTNGKYDPVALAQALKIEKARRSDEFINISDLYDKRSAERPPLLPKDYSGHAAIRAAWQGAPDDDTKNRIRNFVQLIADARSGWLEEFLKVTPARLSGPSRLVFRFDAAGGAVDDIDIGRSSRLGEEKEFVRSIDFSFEGLTDWGRFDLAVHRRAETLEMRPGGRIPHPTLRAIDLDPARILAHQGIQPGRSVDGRLDDIRNSLTAPNDEQTAIELPFRLTLSPDQFARFRTRRPILRNVVREIPKEEHGPSVAPPMLWSATLQMGDQAPVVRAIWSEDFRPGVFGGGAVAPIRGPHAPWDIPAKGVQGARSFRTALDAYDRHEIVALSSVYGLPVMGRRNEFDNLVDGSQFEPPKDYKLNNLALFTSSTSEKKADLSGIYNPSPLGNVRELRLTALGGSLQHDTTFTPPASALRDNRKNGINLFDAFSVERWRQITVLGRDIEVEVVYKGFLFPLGVRATLVKLTERRFVRNDKNGFITAFLIQRKFIRIGNPKKTFPATGQADASRRFPISELTMLTRETPDIVDPDLVAKPVLAALPMPLSGLFFGVRPNGKVDFSEKNSIDFTEKSPLPGLCFWPRTKPEQGGNISFEFKIDGQASPLRMPLLFIDNVAANNRDVVAALAAYYNFDQKAVINGTEADDPITEANRALRTVGMGGVPRRYADEKQDGECHFETLAWEFKAEGRKDQTGTNHNDYFVFDPLLQGSDQPPFYPYIDVAKIRVGQAERFVGRSLPPCDVSFTADYTTDGFPSTANAKPSDLERYLQMAKGRILVLNMGDAGDRSGGVGRHALDAKYLSRRYGLMPEIVPNAIPSAPASQPSPEPDNGSPEPEPSPFNLENFFKDADAKVLGIVSFKELLLQAVGGSAIPELKEKVEAATTDTAAFLQQTVIPEVERALRSLEEMWRAAQRALTSQAGATRGVTSLSIDEVYPDIAPALHDLINKVGRAKAASGLDLIDAMSAVQTSGRRFVTAINRTLADPITPLREELSGKFRIISHWIDQFGKGLGALAQQSIEALAVDIEQKIKTALANQLTQLQPFTRLLLSFPIPDGPPHLPLPPAASLPPASLTVIVQRLDAALAKGAAGLLNHVLDHGLSKEDLREALRTGLEKAKDALETAGLDITAAAVITAYKEQAEKLLDEVHNAATDEVERVQRKLMRQATGVLYPVLFGIESFDGVDGFEGIAHHIMRANELLADIGRRQDALEALPEKIVLALKGIAQALARQQVENLCENLGGRLARSSGTMLAPVQGLAGSLDALLNALDGLVSHQGSLVPPPPHRDTNDSRGVVMLRYRKIRDYLTNSIITDACTADDAQSAAKTIVAKVVPELMALRDAIGAQVLSNAKDYAGKIIGEADAAVTAEAARRINTLVDEVSIFVGSGTAGALDALRELRTSITDPPQNSPINREIATQFGQMRQSILEIEGALETIKKAIHAARATNDVPAKDAIRLLILVLSGVNTSLDASLQDGLDRLRTQLLQEFGAQEKILKDGVLKAMREIDDRIEKLLRVVLDAQKAAKVALVAVTRQLTAPIFDAVYNLIYEPTHTLRDRGRKALDEASAGGGALKSLLQTFLSTLRGPSGGPLADVFSVPPVDNPPSKFDRLDREVELLKGLGNSNGAVDEGEYINSVVGFVESWERRTASPIILLQNLRQILTAVLRGDLAQFVDLHQIRREVDEAIRKMVPARIKRSFDLKLKIGNLGKLLMFEDKGDETIKSLGLPKPHPRGLPGTLVLRANGVVDLLRPENSSYAAEGFLPGFALRILPGFDVATFLFPPATFSGGLGRPFNVLLKVEQVKLGEKVKFLEDIQSILPAPKNGKGFYLRALTGRGSLGIVAGYALPVSPITIGNMFIDNLSLNIAVELPFDKGDARFVMSVSRPEAPFMIAVAPYAGAGHFGLIANPKGIVGFEASFQFGGGGGFSFGPLTGKGRISVGVFVRKISGLTELYGIFYAGGSARIACFGVGAQLYLRMTHMNGNVEGEAIFTYSFSVGIKDIEFSVAVYKRESGGSASNDGGGGGDGDQSRLDYGPHAKTINLAAGEFREVFAQGASTSRHALLVNKTRCMAEHFGTYRKYFVRPSVLAVGRKPPLSSARQDPSVSASIWVMP